MRACTCPGLALLAVLSGCAQPRPNPETANGATPGGPHSCGFRALGYGLRPGEDLQFTFAVKADSQWCFDGFRLSGLSNAGETVATAPRHGDIRLVRQPGAVIIGYRPRPGFSGTDRFRVGVPSEIETTYLAGSVTVAP